MTGPMFLYAASNEFPPRFVLCAHFSSPFYEASEEKLRFSSDMDSSSNLVTQPVETETMTRSRKYPARIASRPFNWESVSD